MAFDVTECIKITKFITFFEAIREPDYVFPGESHNHWECVYVKNGHICVSSDDKLYELKEGDIVFHHPLAFHKYNVVSGKEAELFIFGFKMEGTLTTFFEKKVFSLKEKQIQIIQSLFDFIHEKTPQCYNDKSGNSVLYALDDNDSNIAILANYICSLFLSIYNAHDIIPALASDDALLFKQAVKYMNENAHKKLTIKSISEKCCTNTTALKKLFYEHAGCGVHKYFLTLKINTAINLIASGYSVSKVAEILNFSSQAYFSSAFKRETGVSPIEYKNKILR